MYSCQRYSVARCANFSSLGELLRGRFWIGNSVLLHLKEKKWGTFTSRFASRYSCASFCRWKIICILSFFLRASAYWVWEVKQKHHPLCSLMREIIPKYCKTFYLSGFFFEKIIFRASVLSCNHLGPSLGRNQARPLPYWAWRNHLLGQPPKSLSFHAPPSHLPRSRRRRPPSPPAAAHLCW